MEENACRHDRDTVSAAHAWFAWQAPSLGQIAYLRKRELDAGHDAAPALKAEWGVGGGGGGGGGLQHFFPLL